MSRAGFSLGPNGTATVSTETSEDEALMSMEQVAQMRPMLVPAALAV